MLALLAGASVAHAQTPGMDVLLGAYGARTAGLNGAGVALVGDAGAVFVAPAALATIRHIATEGAYRPLPGGAMLGSAALGWRLGQFDVGLGGRMVRADPTDGAVRPWDGLAVGALVYRFGIIALGASGKYVHRETAVSRTYGVSGDLGVAIAIFDIMAFGFAVQNVSGNWQDTSSVVLPRDTRLGFTMNYTDPQEAFRLLSTVEVQWREGLPARGVLGVEGGVVVGGVGLLGRVGLAGRPDRIGTGRVALGGTLALGWLDLDYAFRPDDVGDRAAHVVGLRLRL
jgi:hypothetical protein